METKETTPKEKYPKYLELSAVNTLIRRIEDIQNGESHLTLEKAIQEAREKEFNQVLVTFEKIINDNWELLDRAGGILTFCKKTAPYIWIKKTASELVTEYFKPRYK